MELRSAHIVWVVVCPHLWANETDRALVYSLKTPAFLGHLAKSGQSPEVAMGSNPCTRTPSAVDLRV